MPDHLIVLLDRYLTGTATAEERQQIDDWYAAGGDSDDRVDGSEQELADRILAQINHRIDGDTGSTGSRHWLRIAAAVLLVALAGFSYHNWSNRQSAGNNIVVQNKPLPDTVLAPGADRAQLTLGDGTVVVLDDTASGAIGGNTGTKIIQLKGGKLRYGTGEANEAVTWNTITTPRGGQYQVELADGTKVWLNAASSLRFPTDFRTATRDVQLTGEAFFEVSKDAKHPFIISTGQTQLQVLGTSFNVMNYSDENACVTTLLTGAVEVKTAEKKWLLSPGNQATVARNGQVKLDRDADIDEAVAWHQGRFVFNSADIHTVMRQVERWYNVDVAFMEPIDLHFSGQLNRYANADALLRKLSLTNEIAFRRKGAVIEVYRPGKTEQLKPTNQQL